jgi:signal recognition particle GTPase
MKRLQIAEARFQDFIAMMLKHKVYNVETHYEYIKMMAHDVGINDSGWSTLNPLKGQVDKEQKEAIEKQLKIVTAFTPQERNDPRNIDRFVKARVAQESGASAKDITEFIKTVDQNAAVHNWLHSRAQRNLPLPNDQAQMLEFVKDDPVKDVPRLSTTKIIRRASRR